MGEHIYHCRLEGVAYTIRGDKPEEELARIVEMVDEKLKDIHELGPSYAGQRAAILAALQLAEELTDSRRSYAELLEATKISARHGVTAKDKDGAATKTKTKRAGGKND